MYCLRKYTIFDKRHNFIREWWASLLIDSKLLEDYYENKNKNDNAMLIHSS